MHYATLRTHDVANGPGVRVSLFVSGCTHRCPGCFNAEAWDFSYGKPFTDDVADRLIAALEPAYIKGLSLLGGEPFEPSNRAVLAPLLARVKERYPEKTVWCYSGYDFERDLLAHRVGDAQTIDQMLARIDILVDGKFVEGLKSSRLRFRGSANQRIICVPESLASGKVVLWDGMNGELVNTNE